jgi:citrate synthase
MTTVHRGLAGVVADQTAVSSVNPDTNSLLYRGYPVQDLAQSMSFEAVAWLLWTGQLPTLEESSSWEREERSQRDIPPNVRAVMDLLPPSAHPMDVVRTAVSALGASDPEAGDDSAEGMLAQSKRLFAVLPALVARTQRTRSGLSEIEPRDDLDYCENFLWMSFGSVPDPVTVDAFRVSMILYSEHSFNASTFAARELSTSARRPGGEPQIAFPPVK